MILIRYNTHITCGLFIGMLSLSPFLNYIILNFNILELSILLIFYFYFLNLGSIFPDIDCPQSYIGKKFPFISKLINTKFHHRGFTHSILFIYFLVLLSFLINIVFKISYPYIFVLINNYILMIYYGFILGCISHILFDMFNSNGVCLLYPSNQKYRLPLAPVIKVNSKSEKALNSFLSFLTDILIIIYIFYYIKFFT
ncbi:metal-dependent hydrolase [Paraclostridium ghonii]|uniref:metal-dependent hydrolase n=1 Tax=Paraclostridium ghonii TaxID=29358 RepID=UPI0033814D53